MKKLVVVLCLVLGVVHLTNAQAGSGFGIKGGINYNGNGKLVSDVEQTVKHPDKNMGYHVGVFAKFGRRLFIKPELVYTNTSSEYNDNTFELQKIDAPVLVGFKILGPLNVFAGPAFQYILKSKYDNIKADEIAKDISVGFNFGVGFNIRRLGIDLRYERGFSKNETTFILDNDIDYVQIDSRPSQVILSASLKL